MYGKKRKPFVPDYNDARFTLGYGFSVMIIVASIIMNLLTWRHAQSETPLLASIIKNHSLPPAFELTVGKDCDDTDKFSNLLWEGFGLACVCNTDEKDIPFKITRENCKKNMLVEEKCKVFMESSKHLLNWKGNDKICLDRFMKQGTYISTENQYSTLLNLFGETRECRVGYKNCGKIDSLGQLLCFPNEWTCPINSVIVSESSTGEFKNIKFHDKNLNYSNKGTNDIIVEMTQSIGEVCSLPNEYVKYPGINIIDENFSSFTECSGIGEDEVSINPQYKLVDSISRYDALKDNNLLNIYDPIIPYNYKPEELKNHFYKLYSRNYIGWKKECLNQKELSPGYINEIFNTKDDNNDKIRNAYYLCIVQISLLFLALIFGFYVTKLALVALVSLIITFGFSVAAGIILTTVRVNTLNERMYDCVDGFTKNALQEDNDMLTVLRNSVICLSAFYFVNAVSLIVACIGFFPLYRENSEKLKADQELS